VLDCRRQLALASGTPFFGKLLVGDQRAHRSTQSNHCLRSLFIRFFFFTFPHYYQDKKGKSTRILRLRTSNPRMEDKKGKSTHAIHSYFTSFLTLPPLTLPFTGQEGQINAHSTPAHL
jgi:hypothetical protein